MTNTLTAPSQLSPPVPKPAHIPDGVVYDFDLFYDAALLRDPHERILDMVNNAPPVFWTPRNGGHWMLLSHSANFSAARDTESFSSAFVSQAQLERMNNARPAGTPHIPNAVPINLDPPAHALYRAPLQRAFSPKVMTALKEEIRALANELIDAVRPRGRCEFMSQIAEPLPVQVFLKLLGLPLERQAEYRTLVRDHMAARNFTDRDRSIANLQKVAAAMRPTLLERREQPRDDLISALWKIEIEGKPTTLEDMENYGVLLFLAGLDTVMNGMGFAVRHLARHPALQNQLRANPQRVIDATEELLRRYTFTVPPRIVGKDVVFQGVPMKKGEIVMLFLPAADLDSREFPHSAQVDLERENKVHIAFNAGPHRCLGSHLARIELQTCYEQLLQRLPLFRLDPERPCTFHGGTTLGIDSLHLVWND